MVELIKAGRQLSLHSNDRVFDRLSNISHSEGVLIETCDRTEWYYGEGEVSECIATHLFRLTSGLESTLIGETAILGQVKRAYMKAQANRSLSKSLHKLFQTSFYVAKKVRRVTELSRGAMSHSQATVQLLEQIHPELKGKKITLIGANYLNEIVIKYLLKRGADTFFVGNRTYNKAVVLSSKYEGKAFRLDALNDILSQTDVLISATAATHLILKEDHFPSNKEMIIFDLAVPRDIDPKIGNKPRVTLFDIEAIEHRILKNLEIRHDEVSKAEKIIGEEVNSFISSLYRKSWLKKRAV